MFSCANSPSRGSCCVSPSSEDAEHAAVGVELLVGEVDLARIAAAALAADELARRAQRARTEVHQRVALRLKLVAALAWVAPVRRRPVLVLARDVVPVPHAGIDRVRPFLDLQAHAVDRERRHVRAPLAVATHASRARVDLVIHQQRELGSARRDGAEPVRQAGQLIAVRSRAVVLDGQQRPDVHAVGDRHQVRLRVAYSARSRPPGSGRARGSGPDLPASQTAAATTTTSTARRHDQQAPGHRIPPPIRTQPTVPNAVIYSPSGP